MKTFTRTVLFTALLGAAAPVLAGPEHPGHGPRGGGEAGFARHLAHTVQRLDLSDAQTEAVKAIFEANKEDLKANFEAGRTLREELQALLDADSLDEAALADIAEREGDLAEERILLTGSVAAQVMAELTDEQKVELQALRAERQDRRRERFSKRGE